ncbi:MAG: toxin-antitoxin system HicB family antitoxin [Acidobacteria bacterium]|nr:toxin-antitoxin system HicB family antitoxin [Acidobacteriota bacterium]
MMTSHDTAAKSGRFLLRMPPPLHAALDGAARAAGLSLNEYCVRRLATAGLSTGDADAVALVSRASDVAGGSLAGVLLHGSRVRGDATATSDVDAIVVVEPRVDLSRALYRTWDEQPVTWQGRPVDAHFVHPPGDDTFSGLWAEAAIDGLVLFDRGGRLAGALARVRRAIADGRIVRRVAHGQPYWAEAS